LAIALHYPIGYNDGRFDGAVALRRDAGSTQKASARYGYWPSDKRYELD
jgi:hypothetical protein